MIKKGDFVELDYTGRIKNDKVVFDTTIEQVARDNGIHNPRFKYKPVIVCIGEGHLVKGLDDALVGKGIGKYTVEVEAEHAFGKKTAELLKLIPMKLFAKDNVKPFVGLEVNVDGSLGIVRSVSGGRVIVDFNHPLASKDLVYDVEIKRIVTDPLEKTRALLELMSVPFQTIDIIDDKAEVVLKTGLPPKEITDSLAEQIKGLVGLKDVKFITKEEAKKEVVEEAKKLDEETQKNEEERKEEKKDEDKPVHKSKTDNKKHSEAKKKDL